ncbi:MAG: hypothetical protein KJ622_05780 [Alphaproteobacteria bacterium]|nr:hypothetical protein [Alphaproteobacteria bacterium]
MTKKDDEFWFKPKHHGYGATPKNWKGWLATAAFAVFIPLLSVAWILSLQEQHRALGVVMLVFAVGYLVWRFIEFSRRKTDGEWMWRWNGQPYRKMLDDEKTRE